MNGAERPPRNAARLLRWAAARLDAPELPDDAAELFAARVRRDGARAARRWYRRQTLATLGRTLLDVTRRPGASSGRDPRSSGRRSRLSGALPGGMSLDVRLGFRMLVRYPGLAVVGGLAMAFAIWAGAVAFETATRMFRPALPLDEPERIVAIETLNPSTGDEQNPVLFDFARWRGALRSLEDLGAFRALHRNLIAPDGSTALVPVSEVTATAFTVARVPPLLGRPLVAADEQPGAAPVAVVAHDVWQRHLAVDPAVVGRSIRLGRSVHTVVGVMPDGFEFPAGEGVWVPLRAATADQLELAQSVRVFGRLTDGATMAEAEAELAALGLHRPPEVRSDETQLRPRVMPYLGSVLRLSELDPRLLLALHVFAVLLVVLICGNVALLMLARAATRETELITRSALGASRGRIVGQLFAEAAALAIVACCIGLFAADLCVRWRFGMLSALGAEGQPPLWERSGLSPATVAYAVALALIASAVAGCVPGLKVTRGLEAGLRRAGAGGGIRFGGIWTVIVVTQVAAMVAFPPIASILRGQAADIRSIESGFDDEEFLQLRLELDRETTVAAPSGDASLSQLEVAARALERRLESEADVVGVTFSDGPPLMTRAAQRIEVDAAGTFPDSTRGTVSVKRAAVAPDYLALLNAPILAGRGFTPADIAADARVVIVNQSFVDRALAGRNPIGQRIRYVRATEQELAGEPEPWYEIVGLVRDIGRPTVYEQRVRAGVYHPLVASDYVTVHMRGEADGFVPRLRSLAAAVDPTLRLHDPVSLAQINREDLYFVRLQFWLVTVVSAGALLLSLAGIYSVLSFTVSQRTREMGVRLALGGGAWHVAGTMVRRPLALVGIGVLVGAFVTAFLVSAVNGVSVARALGVAGYIVLMVGVCTLASLVPVRRALAIEPTEALKTDG